MGIDASRSANSNRSKQQERRNSFRNILCENLERREVMAGDVLDLDFRLLSVAPNTGEILSTTRSNTLNESPRELIFRFAGGDDVRQTTLRNGIRITRAGGDGVFGTGGVSTDIVVTPEYLDFADAANKRVVVARFSQPLPDDLYNVEIFGVDLPAQGINAVRNVVNDPLKPRKTGTDRDSYVFNLELGSKITAIVPQPLNRATDGTLSQDLDTIEVYFNDSELYDRKISTGDLAPSADPTVVNPRFYNLIATGDSVSPFDDRVFNPIKVTFDPATKMASLQFAGPIHALGGSGTYRLRVGSDSPISSAINNPTVPTDTPVVDPQGYLSGAYSINAGVPISGSFSSILQQEIRTVSDQLLLDLPGSAQEPGHRDIQEDRSLRTPDVIWGPPNFSPDSDAEIKTIKFSFMENQAYGVDTSGRRLFTSISSEQKTRVREVFEFYSRYLGIDFQEYAGPLGYLLLDVPPNGGAAFFDNTSFTITNNGITAVFEFDGNGSGSTIPNSVVIPFTAASTQADIINALVAAINAYPKLGVIAKDSGNGSVDIGLLPDSAVKVRDSAITTSRDTREFMSVIVGDMIPVDARISGPGDVLGVAGTATDPDNPLTSWNMVILDGSEPWDNAFGYGVSQKPLAGEIVPDNILAQAGPFSFFTTAMHEIGHLLSLDHTYDLPAGTIMGSDSNGGVTNSTGGVVGTRLNSSFNPIEQIFPGIIDQIHGQHAHRPDNRDVDLYRFELTTNGQVRLETIAERLNDSSNLDTHLTLMKRDAVTGALSIVSVNNNYISQDSLIDVPLTAGEYFVAVTGKGNEDNDPQVLDTGSGATSQGRYQLRFDFKSTNASSISEQSFTSTAVGSALDGDGDGIAGGDFNFWFRAADGYGTTSTSPRTLIVDKAYTGLTRVGTLAQPFNTISAAVSASQPGDIIRLAGLDEANPLPSLTSVRAYEIGKGAFGSTLSDGDRLEVPRGVTLMIDAGAILKLGNARIMVGSDGVIDRSGAAIQVLGTPTLPVYFTSYTDQSLGIDTNPLETTPKAGDWGGVEIRNDVDRSQGRFDREREGIFLNTISNARMTFGGGLVGSGAQAKVTSPIELGEARPLILGNSITRSADSAISADPNSFEETLFTEPRYQNAGAFVPDYRRVGPVIYNNDIRNNTINGLFVRVETLPGQPLKSLTTHARIDDSEVTLVFGENLLIAGTPGGSVKEISGPNTSLMLLSNVVPTSGNGFANSSALEYIVTYMDRFGQESLPSLGKSIVVPANRSVQLSNIPVATGDYVSRRVYRRVNNTGSYQLASVLNKDDTVFVDNNITFNGAIQTLGLTQVHRSRQDSTLVVDPGIVAKLLGTRIEVGIGATLIAEGTEAKPVIFTSRLDDRYGAAGTFDTNNDGSATTGAPGNWSGIVARHMSELSIDHAVVTFGGGESRIPGGFASFNAIEVHQGTARIANSLIERNASGRTNTSGTNRDARGNNDGAAIFVLSSQPVIINNIIRDNSASDTAAISVDHTSLSSKPVRDTGRSTGFNQREANLGLGNYGPLVFNNRLGGNGLNGMRVRGGTLVSESIWDDTDIVHILQSEIIVPDFHTFGGLRLTSKVDSSLVVKASNNAGITAAGRPLDIKDRIGGTVQILGSQGFPVVITSLSDDSIGAGFDDEGASLRDTNNDGSASAPQPGNWRSIRFTPFSNDRNVDMTYEKESDRIASSGSNDNPFQAEDIGKLAADLKLGDENLRLGVTLTGSIASPKDMDVYRFSGVAGSTIWLDIDQTSGSLDSVLELIDESGRIMALSDDSLAESIADQTLDNPAYSPAIKAFPMDQNSTAIENSLATGSNVDFQATNPRDPGLRIVLPGVAGTSNLYYIRVRSSNKQPGVVTDPYDTTSGITTGAYKLHVRLQERQEIAGSTVRYADLRYATNGIEIFGNTMHSPLVGEFAEPLIDGGIQPSTAIDVGNVMVNDRAGVSIAGNLTTAADIDWFDFSVGRDEDSIQQLPANTPNTPLRVDAHGSLIFDIDYADGVGRANTQLWVFRRDAGGNRTLVLTADDSNIQDDQPAVLKGTDQTDLTRGSLGKRDAYIGPIELPPGNYSVAVTNKSVVHFGLTQFTQSDISGIPGAAEIRLEPLDSVARLGEDRFEQQPPLTTADGAPTVFAGGQVPFTLADVTLFTARTDTAINAGKVSFLNPMTGAVEAHMSRSGNAQDVFTNGYITRDMAVSPAGTAMGFRIQDAGQPITDTNAGQFFGIDIGDTGLAIPGINDSGIITWARYVDANGNLDVRQSQINQQAVGDGMVFTALAYTSLGASGRANFFGVATRRLTGSFNETPNAPLPRTRNIIYQLDPDTGVAQNWQGLPVRTEGDYENGVYNMGTTAGTNIQEAGYFLLATGTVNGLTTVGDQIYGVTDQGELVTPTIVNVPSTPSRVIIRDPLTNNPINFTGMTRGPANVENGRFADVMFGVTAAGRLYAFDTTGALQPIFPFGESSIDLGVASVSGIDFTSLDVNLWGVSGSDPDTNVAGHGRTQTFNRSGDSQNVPNNTMRFAFTNPGNRFGVDDFTNTANTYAMPGGAWGAFESTLLDLSRYSSSDQPVMYFNYNVRTENSIANNDGNIFGDGAGQAFMDSFRVYGAGEDGQWVLLTTNNSAGYIDQSYAEGVPFPPFSEYDVPRNGNQDPFGRSFISSSAFDNQGWRQARVNLGALAGKRDVKIRFEFNSGGDFRTNVPDKGGFEVSAIPGDRIADGQTFIITDGLIPTTFEFDIGLVLNVPSGSSFKNGDQLKIGPNIYTFAAAAGPMQIPFASTDSPEEIAASINNVLTADGYRVLVSTASPNILNITHLNGNPLPDSVLPDDYDLIGPDDAIMTGKPGVAAGNVRVRIDNTLPSTPTAQIPIIVRGDIYLDGEISFADIVPSNSYDPNAGGAAPIAGLQDITQALGQPDYVGLTEPVAGDSVVSLGSGGSMVLEFADNFLTASGDLLPDLAVYEAGDSEDVLVEVSYDGITYIPVGTVSGLNPYVDLDAFGFSTESLLRFVRLTDDAGQGATSGDSVGADIDAVGAISSRQRSIRDELRISLAQNYNVVGQENNTEVWRYYGDTVRIFGTAFWDVLDPGVLRYSTGGRIGDVFGPTDTNFPITQAARRALNNGTSRGNPVAPTSVTIDDIVISFAERGEMVSNGQAVQPVFVGSFQYEGYGGPNGAGAPELETGAYQLELRTAPDYGKTEGQNLSIAPVPFVGPKGRTFDTNDRLLRALAIDTTGLTGRIGDGYSFTVSNGVNVVTFEFNVFTTADVSDPAFRPDIPGRIRIPLSPNASDNEIALAVRDAINDPAVRAVLGLTVENNGDMFGTALYDAAHASTIQFNGLAASDVFANSAFLFNDASGNPVLVPGPTGAPVPLGFNTIKYGQDTQWGEDSGDANILRDQGQLIISGVAVTRSSNFGINMLPAPRDLSDRFINMDQVSTQPFATRQVPISTEAGNRPYPGSVRNMITLNNSQLAPGAVIVNNILAGNASGGIRVGGDAAFGTVAQAPTTVTRIVNNTIYGLNTGAGQSGILVEPNTSPTILSNILANLATGINVPASVQPSIVVGANLYQGNVTNITAGTNQSFPIDLGPTQPLFTDPARDRFYLKALSQAIDSSIASLEDRNLLDQVRSAVGLPTSPIIAPEFDAYGLLRSDDPSVSTPGGLGSNVFADRGALDRVDLDGPLAILQRPLDNDAAGVDLDGSNTYVQLKTGNIDYFEILIDERQGTGPDPLTITQDNVVLTENGRMLSPGVDYVFGYSFNSRTIRLTPLAGFWRQDSVYELTLINKPTVRVIAPDDAVNRIDGDRFTVSLASGGTRSLELDSGFILTVPAAGVSDGQTFTYTPAGGETITFEFNLAGNAQTTFATKVITYLSTDTPDQLAAKIAAVVNPLIRQDGWPVQAIPGGRVVVGGNVGDTMNVSSSSLVLSGGPGAQQAGAIPVRFLPVAGFDAFAMSTALTQALNQIGSGVKAYSLANGLVFVEGINSISGMTASLSIPAIQDLAGNNLQANRANSLTQFTILMPEVNVDYGDAIQRPGTGSSSSTLLADNGVRHGLYPDDATLLVLGAYADGETDGQPSAAADADDFDSAIDFGTLASYLSVSTKGPARLVASAFDASMIGKSLTISDTVSKSVTYEFTNGGAVVIPGARAVDLTGAVTDSDVASRLQGVILASILDGSITGIHASASGSVISLGGTTGHRFDLSNALGALARSQSGTNEVVVGSNLTGLAAGNTMFLTDGFGNSVGFQVVDSNPLASPSVLGVGNVAVSVNLATVTPNSFATALASAINKAISDSKLKLPTVSVVNDALTVSADDEDGVQFGSWFNANSLATPVTLTASASGFVDAWIDWNQDNDFEDPGERILSTQPVIAGANTFYVTTPASAAIGFTTARFRISSTGGLFTYGLGIGGEVEDHMIEVLAGSPPVANADSFIVAEDDVLIVPAAGVLTNDTDADAQAIRVFDSDLTQPGVQPVRGPQHGYLTLSADGSFVYTPKQDFFGTDTFIYLATDPRMTSNVAATVTITVTPVNDAPVAVDDVETINEDQTITWDGSRFTANDRTQPDRPTGTDGDIYDTNESGQILRVVDAELVVDRGLGETLTLINNRITYTPPTDYNNLINGPVLVRILIEDSGVAGGDELPKRPGMDDTPPTLIYSTLTININDVNDQPLFNIPRPTQTPLEDATVSASGFLNLIFPGKSTTDDELGLVTGIPAQTVRFQVTALDPTRFTPAGQPAIAADGTLTYTLNTDVNALNSLPILVEVIAIDSGNAAGSRPGRPDENRSAPKTFTILPVEVNDAPLFSIPNPEINILEDLEVSPVSNFVTNIVAGPPTATDELGLNPPTVGQTVSFEVTAVDPTRFNGVAGQPRINAAGQLSYDLSPDVNLLNSGPILVRVVAVDSGPAAGSRPGIPDVNRSIEQTFTILVQDVNDAPGFTIPNPTIAIQEDLENSPLPGFLTNIVAGPESATDELGLNPPTPGQTISFNVRALDPSRFSVQPTITPDGTLSYDLAPNVNLLNSGPILVEVIAVDSGNAPGSRPGIPDVNRSAPQTFTLSVQDVNDAPEFTVPNATITINEDLENSPLTGFLAGILPGPSSAVDEIASQTVSFTVTAVDPTRFNGSAGQPSISPTGVLTYDLAPDVNIVNSGPILIRVRAVDNGPAPGSRPGIPDVNSSAEITVTLLVNAVNDAPLFTIPNPIISIDEDLEVSPVNGFATNIAAGPATAIDELGLVSGVPAQTLSFDVQAVDPSKFNGVAGQPRISPTGVLTYDLAPDVNILNSGPILVRVSLVDNGSNTSPNVNRSTTQTFTIRVKEINDPPIFDMSFNSFSMREDDGFLTLPGFITNLGPGPLTATDESNQTTNIIAVAVDPTAFTVQPLVTGTGDLTFQLAPDVNSLFKDTRIRLIATDNGVPAESTEKILTLNVADINDEPQYTIPTTLVSVLEDNESVTGLTPTRVVGFATNVRPGPATAVDEVSQTLTFNVTFNSNTGLFSTQPSISSTGELSFVTAPNQNGTAVIIVNLVDNGRPGPFPNDNIGPNATFTITVRPINDAPEFTIPSSTTSDEDQGVVSVPNFATGIRPGPVTAGDESNQELTFEVVAFDPTAFAVQPTLGVDGTLVYQTAKDINSNSGKDTRVRVTLRDNGASTPPPNTNVSIQSVFTVNIVPVNDPPISAGYLTTTTEDSRVTVQTSDVLANDLPGPADEVAEGQTIRMTNIEQLTARGGVVIPVFSNGRITRFDYLPPLNFVGQDFIRYVVTDDATYKPGQQSATGTITISVGPINDPPQFTAGGNVTVLEDSAPYSASWATNILAGPPAATDENSGPNAQTVSFEVTTNNDAMFAVRPAVNSAGQLSFTLAKDANGSVSIVVVAVDNGPSSPPPNNNRSQPATFTLSVTPVNDPPGFNVTRNITVDEDSGAFTGIVLADIVPAEGMNSNPPTALDEANQTVSISTTVDKPALFTSQPTVDANGVLRFTPAPNASGVAVVSVVATDNGPSTSPNVNRSQAKTFSITINPINDAPVALNNSYSTDEHTILNVTAPGVLANDTDPDLPNDSLSVASFQSTSDLGAAVTVRNDGSVVYNPTVSAKLRAMVDGQSLVDTFTYRAKDAAGLLSNVATVSVTVSGINDAPVANDDTFTVPFNVSELLPVLANDTDVDTPLDIGSIEIGRLPVNGTVAPTSSGTIRYTPRTGFRGQDTFTYRVRDALGKYSQEATVTVNVNTAPVAVPDSAITKRDTQVVIDVLANDFDTDGTINRSTVNIVTPPNFGTAVAQSDGRVLFIPQAGFTGTATFAYAVSDNDGLSSNVATVTVQVVASLYQNPSNKYDVNNDSFVSPIDVLLIINLLNSTGASIPVDQLPPPPPFYDVNGNGFVDATDVLSLVDYINSTGNSGSGEGEQEVVDGTSRLAIGLLAAPQPEVVQQAVLYNMAGAQANAWATLSDEAELYGPTLFPIDSEDENAVEFWASFAQGNDERIDSNDIDDEFLKGTWM